jgi:hypothetical protein
MKLLGFIIANDYEEFLESYSIRGDIQVRSWSRIPDIARLFKTRNQASIYVKKMALPYRTWILKLYDNGRYFVVEA